MIIIKGGEGSKIKLHNINLLKLHRKHKDPYFIKVKSKRFIIYPDVFNPLYSMSSRIMLENIKIKKGGIVLELGAGSGVHAILNAKKAKRVIATDLNEIAVKCTRGNVKIHGLENKIEVRSGDLFSPIKKYEKFDVIIFNPPFHSRKARDSLEISLCDYKYRLLTRFFDNVGYYLKRNGRVYLSYSNIGDFSILRDLIKKNNLKAKIIAKKIDNGVLFKLFEIRKLKV